MSTPTVINSVNSPSDILLADYMTKASRKLLLKKRFDFGSGICWTNMLEALFIESIICGDACYLDEDDHQIVRERLIQISILD
jgi:hypothetical protein